MTTRTTLLKPKPSRKTRATAAKRPTASKKHGQAVGKKLVQEAKIETKTEPHEGTAGHIAKAKYTFATGRRKTAVANVRLFEGAGKNLANKKPLEEYFAYSFYQQTALQPFDLTGLSKHYHFTAQLRGGGTHAQAEALSHGLALTLSKSSAETRKVLKKNGLLTRDDRVKERKKPGLKRARRAPQWAKR